VNVAIDLLKGALEWVRNPAAVEELIAYLEKRRAYIPNYYLGMKDAQEIDDGVRCVVE